jgi:hypothetical protein
MVAGEESLQRLTEVMQQVPAVGNLSRVWSSLLDGTRVLRGPIASNDLHARALSEPTRKRLCRAIRQEVHGPSPLQIDEYGPIALAFAKRPIIDAEHAW